MQTSSAASGRFGPGSASDQLAPSNQSPLPPSGEVTRRLGDRRRRHEYRQACKRGNRAADAASPVRRPREPATGSIVDLPRVTSSLGPTPWGVSVPATTTRLASSSRLVAIRTGADRHVSSVIERSCTAWISSTLLSCDIARAVSRRSYFLFFLTFQSSVAGELSALPRLVDRLNLEGVLALLDLDREGRAARLELRLLPPCKPAPYAEPSSYAGSRSTGWRSSPPRLPPRVGGSSPSSGIRSQRPLGDPFISPPCTSGA